MEDLFGDQKLSLSLETVQFSNFYIYGFRFVNFLFGDIGFVGPTNKSIFKNKLYSGIGIGVRIRNDNLVFKTFQLRLTYYPSITPGYEHLIFRMTGEKLLQPPSYKPHAPEIIEYH